jgi:hypothetical protein
MHDEDIDAICRIESQAFGNWWKLLTGQEAALPQRTQINI